MAGTLGKLNAAMASVQNEASASLATLNFDFTLIKLEAPVEFHGLGSTISRKRKEGCIKPPDVWELYLKAHCLRPRSYSGPMGLECLRFRQCQRSTPLKERASSQVTSELIAAAFGQRLPLGALPLLCTFWRACWHGCLRLPPKPSRFGLKLLRNKRRPFRRRRTVIFTPLNTELQL
jgi:hypothetical protein